MEKQYVEKTNTIYKEWDPYYDVEGYGIDRSSPAFVASVDKLNNYYENKVVFKYANKDAIVVKEDDYEYEELIPRYKIKLVSEMDKTTLRFSSRRLSDLAADLWITNVVGPCAHRLD